MAQRCQDPTALTTTSVRIDRVCHSHRFPKYRLVQRPSSVSPNVNSCGMNERIRFPAATTGILYTHGPKRRELGATALVRPAVKRGSAGGGWGLPNTRATAVLSAMLDSSKCRHGVPGVRHAGVTKRSAAGIMLRAATKRLLFSVRPSSFQGGSG